MLFLKITWLKVLGVDWSIYMSCFCLLFIMKLASKITREDEAMQLTLMVMNKCQIHKIHFSQSNAHFSPKWEIFLCAKFETMINLIMCDISIPFGGDDVRIWEFFLCVIFQHVINFILFQNYFCDNFCVHCIFVNCSLAHQVSQGELIV